jgi:hypothetical protein
MMPLYADNFLAGSILTLVLPVSLLIVVAFWYMSSLRRIPDRDPDTTTHGAPTGPPPVPEPGPRTDGP